MSSSTTLYLNITDYETVTDVEYPQEDYSYRGTVYHDMDIRSISTTSGGDKWNQHRIEVPFAVKPGDTVNMIVVKYSTGDTFGATHGLIAVNGGLVFPSHDDAVAALTELKQTFVRDFSPNWEDPAAGWWDKWWPWCGYFESVDHYDIQPFIVR